ncbi:hypothetical protein [Agrobacterium pusense]|jgi:hypothetical protein|uniref:hypothetical protein n=1 Tax=Agrobacterium pusense TaxID=648995 RepID=UPI002452A4E4|nr:hypothetical protein [Agrobacterium pusense]
MSFFAIRYVILVLLISSVTMLNSSPESIRGNIGGIVFNVACYSVAALLIYWIVLFVVSAAASFFTATNRFPLSFQTVLLADTLFLYAMLVSSSWLFLAENSSMVSVGGLQGELVVNGVKTILGWRDSAQNAIRGIRFAIVLHILFSVHNYVATTKPLGKQVSR